MEQHTNGILTDGCCHLIEHIETSKLVLNNRVLAAVCLQGNTLTKLCHVVQMRHPFLIDDLQQYDTLDLTEMLWRIKALLRRAKIASERRIVVGDVVLDYDCLTVSRKGEVQELPQKEFLLLYKLLSYPGKIFTRIQLMDEIWGADSDTGWETVTVHVGRLRKRFQDWPEFTIESVRGLGYKAVKKV